MCPDRQIISLYFDSELPSPWKEKMESHLETCPECRAALAGYGSLGKQPGGLKEENILAAQERVWKKLTAPALIVSEKSETNTARRSSQKFIRQGIWNRSIPLPAAAAAAIFIIMTMFAVFGIWNRSVSRPQEVIAAIPDYMQVVGNDQGTVPITDMTGVLQYLSSLDNGEFMVIRLPESKNFIRAGEPALINAADYSRRRMPR